MKKKILIIIVSCSLFLSLILIGYVLISSISDNKSLDSDTTKSTKSVNLISSTISTDNVITISTTITTNNNTTVNTTTASSKVLSTSVSTEVITTSSNDDGEYLLYPEKNKYLLSDTQINLIIRRKDGNEFTYNQRYKLYRKINNEWVVISTKDKSNTYKPIAYRAIKTDKLDYARGFIRVYLDDFDYQFESGEYKVELIFWEGDLSTVFNIVH